MLHVLPNIREKPRWGKSRSEAAAVDTITILGEDSCGIRALRTRVLRSGNRLSEPQGLKEEA